MSTGDNPFRLPLKSRFLAATLERLLGLSPLAQAYERRPALDINSPQAGPAFLDFTLAALDIGLDIGNPQLLETVPRSGPVIFVANHPLGGLEGVAMTQLLLKTRPDTKVLTNKLLSRIPEFNQLFIGVDVLSRDAARDNARGIRAVYQHLGNGGALLIYPAGMVSALNLGSGAIEDRPWNPLVGRLARRYAAHCVPFFVEGYNSRLFYLLGLIHPRLRTLMLARELANKRGRRFTLRIGRGVPPAELEALDSEQAVTHYLRLATDILKLPPESAPDPQSATQPVQQDPRSTRGLAELRRDIAGLADCRLLAQRKFAVYCAPYARLGSVMNEIARVRELTFRAAGEGTGKSLDKDQFDPHYLHLFVWDTEREQIVGGYRMGRVDEIVRERGLSALYSRSLYHFDQRYLKSLGNTLEMGRSFVAPDYQRHPRALDLLWRGIGAYLAQHPQYHTLFGCVSISQEHSKLARAFLSESMMHSFRVEQEHLAAIRPVKPLKVRGKVWTREVLASLSSLVVINKLIGRWNAGKTIPVLLRHYLALNGRFVCFSVNAQFNNSLDGLILVDLRKTPHKYLQRYLGKAGTQQFLKRWGLDEVAA
ncbi:lysophospholipid acyltransferase family protein [Exilibacterium tricleocarpae]|uniref:L-ornithine N(alpha)-acyltransferase n=1 Tax=Exilibacterium tricleocarpae TaxID=2591008 RepID=A0A545T687_9GAMM|nr:GNAT family N-acyltransferase [Exilibacterium tricleocarpae]TQV72734.1 lysophospholipid acyltransferase family protein [Exilibacterium tricleocarpae]